MMNISRNENIFYFQMGKELVKIFLIQKEVYYLLGVRCLE